MAEEMMEQGEGGGSQIEQLVSGVMKGMGILGQVLEKAGAPDELKQGLADCMGQFEQVVQALSGGQGQAPQKGGSSPVQESQGRPVSPAGV